jgi:exosortase H (IPTLxxWG-CTERM-specific)
MDASMSSPQTRAARERSWLTRLRLTPSTRFVLSFAAISAVLFGVYFFPYAENGGSEAWFTAYLARYARLVGHALNLLEPQVSVSGNIVSGRFSMSIVKSCDGMEANILFCAAMLAFPGPWLRKGLAVALGLTALVGFNVLRLCSLYYVGVYFPSAFEFAHFDLWPLLVIGFALIDFLFFARWMHREDSTNGNSSTATDHAAA